MYGMAHHPWRGRSESFAFSLPTAGRGAKPFHRLGGPGAMQLGTCTSSSEPPEGVNVSRPDVVFFARSGGVTTEVLAIAQSKVRDHLTEKQIFRNQQPAANRQQSAASTPKSELLVLTLPAYFLETYFSRFLILKEVLILKRRF